jgi:hypothetical protein
MNLGCLGILVFVLPIHGLDNPICAGRIELIQQYLIKGNWNNNQIPGCAQLSVSDGYIRSDRDAL